MLYVPCIYMCVCVHYVNQHSYIQAYLFMEYCDGGTVANRLKSLKGGVFRDSEAVRLARQILSAIGYMHAKGFVHRDVKLENMLYRTKAIDSPVVLVDFGISRNFRDKRRLMTSAVGSPWYLAPEQIKRLYDEKCDVWSLGVSIFWILSGHPPFGWREAANIQRKYKGKSDESRMDMLIGQAITKAIITAEEPPDCVAYVICLQLSLSLSLLCLFVSSSYHPYTHI
jgi:serine/threonine protein kinase